MLNKKTVLIFADSERALTATAIKEQIIDILSDSIVIVIDDMELHADAMLDYIEKVFKLKVNLDKHRALREERASDKKLDLTPKSTNLYRNRNSYKKMENIFNRYTPDLVVTLGRGALQEAVAVRDKLNSPARVVSVIDEYALNRQLINTYIDAYIVENMAIKTTLVNNYVKESKVIMADLPVAKAFIEAPSNKEAVKELKLDVKKPTVLSVAVGKGNSGYMFDVLKNYTSAYNVVLYTGENRDNYAEAQARGLSAYNEGASLPLLYAAADIVVTPPVATYAAIARRLGKVVALTAAASGMEERNAKYLSQVTFDASDAVKLGELLDGYLSEGSEVKSAATAHSHGVEVGAELVKFIK